MSKADDSAKVLQTKRILAGQLMQLLEHKSFKKITVNDICQSAMVSRSTFYLHFEDKYQLFRYCMEQELSRLESAIQEKDIKAVTLLTLDMLLAKKNFYYNTLAVETDQELNDIFMAAFCRFFATQIEERQRAGHQVAGPISIASAFYAGGVTAANVQWIKNNFDITKEEMAACLENLLSDFQN